MIDCMRSSMKFDEDARKIQKTIRQVESEGRVSLCFVVIF